MISSSPATSLWQLYRSVLRIRRIEERIAELYVEQQMRCPVHLCIGQEAIAAGVCLALGPQDQMLSGHRSHGHFIARGGDLPGMMAELYGKATGCSRGRGGSMHLIDLDVGFLGATPIVASCIPMATGAAFASQMRGEDRVVVVFFGDGATEEGVFHESLDFARLKDLPVLFVCENNYYSVYSPIGVRQHETRDLMAMVASHGIRGASGDGNDAEEVYRLASEAVNAIRAGGGPRFLLFPTYRWLEHCGPHDDDGLGYRPAGELARWKERCPVRLLEQRLDQAVGELAVVRAAIDEEIEAAVEFALASAFPSPDQVLDSVTAP